jgi:hypothetical protein
MNYPPFPTFNDGWDTLARAVSIVNSAVPEPVSMKLAGAGLLAIFAVRRFKNVRATR